MTRDQEREEDDMGFCASAHPAYLCGLEIPTRYTVVEQHPDCHHYALACHH